MDKKMTSGEIAKKAGVSLKAVRLYDEKGLLKPTDYTEGNYRLYDSAALQVLEKIIALKLIGFSLEEIRDNLIVGNAKNIETALRMQLKIMEDKRYQIDKVIDAINRTLNRKSEELDWDDVAQIVQTVILDQGADERHWEALKHTSEELDWYVRIFNSLNIKENEKVLDLGCGFAKLWRNNWTTIPKGTTVFGYDVHGSWADDFEKFIQQNKDSLNEDVTISLEFADLENEESWETIKAEKEYSLIIAHYLNFELKNPEALVCRASQMLSKKGMFSFNGPAVSNFNLFFQDVMKAIDVKASFIDDRIKQQTIEEDATVAMLQKYFVRVEPEILPNTWHYTDAEELIMKMNDIFSDQKKFICENHDRIKNYFEEKIAEDGEVAVKINAKFWHCYGQ